MKKTLTVITTSFGFTGVYINDSLELQDDYPDITDILRKLAGKTVVIGYHDATDTKLNEFIEDRGFPNTLTAAMSLL